jgi:hypothetical protein
MRWLDQGSMRRAPVAHHGDGVSPAADAQFRTSDSIFKQQITRSFETVIARQRVARNARPMTGSAKQPIFLFVPRAKALRFHAGIGAGRAIGIGLNVKAIRKAPSPMIQEPI